MGWEYRFETTSVEGFVQQLAVAYVARGYWFYVPGWIPERKDPRSTDEKLLERYGIARSRWSRVRRKRAGLANIHYIRHGRFFVLLATHGEHPFFEEEAGAIRDLRRRPVQFAGYSIAYRNGHASVRIALETYRMMKALFLDQALRRNKGELEAALEQLPFEPYAPIRSQMFGILRAVNRERKVAGLEPADWECLRLRRRVVRPFESSGVSPGEVEQVPARLHRWSRRLPATA